MSDDSLLCISNLELEPLSRQPGFRQRGDRHQRQRGIAELRR
jgi:hypothetical protein